MQIEKFHDEKGTLISIKGSARNILTASLHDEDICDAHLVFRKVSPQGRVYRHLEHRLLCANVFGEEESNATDFCDENGVVNEEKCNVLKKLIERDQRFVLYSMILPLSEGDKQTYIAQDISGEDIIEALILDKEVFKALICAGKF